MKVVILSASPKGPLSHSLQNAKYLMKKFPDIDMNVVFIDELILEKFDEVIGSIKEADALIWVYPIFFCMIPSQLFVFIELIFEKKAHAVFKDKYATSISSSGVNFYDYLAHNYIRSISEDLDMKYVDGYSSLMMDLEQSEIRDNLIQFGNSFFHYVKNKRAVYKRYLPLKKAPNYRYEPEQMEPVLKTGNHKIYLITDAEGNDSNLDRMVKVFLNSLPNQVRVINLNKIDVRGCDGCMRCMHKGQCHYQDEISDFYENSMDAQAIIMALSIKNRFFSSLYKKKLDRKFCHGHSNKKKEKYFGYLISGSLSENENLRLHMDIMTEPEQASFDGNIVTDEGDDSTHITALIKNLTDNLIWSIENRYHKPMTFIGVAAHKIFRDLVCEKKGVLRYDHVFYKKNKLYDFPNKSLKTKSQNFALRIVTMFFGKWFYDNISSNTQKMYQRIIDKY